jgi:hypothetical protein
MEDKKLTAKEALKYLKAGYTLVSALSGEDEYFVFDGKSVQVRGENEGLTLSDFRFLELYKDSLFEVDDEENDEDAVDPKKDEEYYSWRQ